MGVQLAMRTSFKVLMLFATLILSTQSQSVMAQSQVDPKPYLSKVMVSMPANSQECVNRAGVPIQNIVRATGATMFGVSGPMFFENGGSCFGYIFLSSDKPLSPAFIKSEFESANFAVQAIVDNSSATFIGVTLTMSSPNGAGQDCSRRNEKLIRFRNLTEGYRAMNSELQKLATADQATQLKWINKYFSCPNLAQANTLRLQMDLTNQAFCPLSQSTVNTCFIARGLKAFNITLKLSEISSI